MRIKKKMISGVALSILAIVSACKNETRQVPMEHSVILTKPTTVRPTVLRSYCGVVRESQVINLGFKVPGQISRIEVKEGDRVHRGQLLAKLDDKDYRLGVKAVQIQYEQLKDEVARSKMLLEQKSLSANDFEKAEAGLRQLHTQLQINQNKLDYTSLYAPADGYIQAVNFSSSEMVDAGTAVMTLMDVSQLEVTVDIPLEIYQESASIANYSCIVVNSGLSKKYPMRLLSLLPKADGNQTYQLRLVFMNKPDRNITSGMNVEVQIESAMDSVDSDCMMVPQSAVFRDGQQTCVWVFRSDSTVCRRPVVLNGSVRDGMIMVTGGLKDNERIVRAGVNVLQAGEKVRVLDKPSETNVGGML